MRLTRRWRVALATVVLVSMLGLAAASGLGTFALAPGREDGEAGRAERDARCDGLAGRAADLLQAYVDQLGAPVGQPGTEVVVPRDLGAESAALRGRIQAEGCDSERMRHRMGERLAGLTGQGPVAQAVAARLRASVLGDPTPSAGPAGPRDVAAGEDLAAAVAATPAGGVLRLGPGDHRLTETLVVLAGVRIVGAGRDATRVVTSAADAGLLLLADGRVALQDLTLVHEGEAAASVVVVATGTLALSGARVGGGVSDSAGGGGHGIVSIGAAGTGDPADEPSTVEASEVLDNAAGGVTVLGGPPFRVTDTAVTGNGACGVCVLAGGVAEVSGGRVAGNTSGVVGGGTASLTLTGTAVESNAEAGLVLDQQAAADVTGVSVAGNGAAGVVLRGASTGTLRDTTVTGHGEVGVAIGGASRATLTGGSVEGSRIAVQVEGEGSPVVEGTRLVATQAAVLLGGTGPAVVRAVTCEGPGARIVVLGAAEPDVAQAGCRVVRQPA